MQHMIDRMMGRMVDRRSFVAATTTSLLLPELALSSALNNGTDTEFPVPYYAFHDERFDRSRQLINEISSTGRMIAVRGDPTTLWNEELRAANLPASLLLVGVTTESFFFCLKVLLQKQAGTEALSYRIDRDLHAWSILGSNQHHDRMI